MYAAIIALMIMLAVPAATWALEGADLGRRDINRMADRDRAAQAVRLPNRRMRYTTFQPLPDLNRFLATRSARMGRR